MTNNSYIPGDHNVICAGCHKKRKASQCRPRWDGLLMCDVEGCWDRKHPYLEPTIIPNDLEPVMNARPRPTTPTFVADTTSGLSTWENILPLPTESGSPTNLQISNGTLNWEDADIKWENT